MMRSSNRNSPSLARLARLRETRGLARGGGKVAVAQAAASALAQDEALAVLRKVGDQLALGLRAGSSRRRIVFSRERSTSIARPLAAVRNNGRWLELARKPARVVIGLGFARLPRRPAFRGQSPHQRAAGNLDDEVLAGVAVHAFAQAELAVLARSGAADSTGR